MKVLRWVTALSMNDGIKICANLEKFRTAPVVQCKIFADVKMTISIIGNKRCQLKLKLFPPQALRKQLWARCLPNVSELRVSQEEGAWRGFLRGWLEIFQIFWQKLRRWELHDSSHEEMVQQWSCQRRGENCRAARLRLQGEFLRISFYWFHKVKFLCNRQTCSLEESFLLLPKSQLIIRYKPMTEYIPRHDQCGNRVSSTQNTVDI